MTPNDIADLIQRRLKDSHSDHLQADIDVHTDIADGCTVILHYGDEGQLHDKFEVHIEKISA